MATINRAVARMNPFLLNNAVFIVALFMIVALFRNRKKTRINKKFYYYLIVTIAIGLFQSGRVLTHDYKWLLVLWNEGIEIYPEASFYFTYTSKEYGNKRAWGYRTKDSSQQVVSYYRGVIAKKLSIQGRETSVDDYLKFDEGLVQINFPDRAEERFFIYVTQRGKSVGITYYLKKK